METLKVYIGANWNKFSETFTFHAYNSDMTEYGYHTIEVVEIPVNPPSDEVLRNKVAAALVTQKNKVLADAWVQAQKLQEEADNLLALPAPKREEETSSPDVPDDCPF